MIDGKYRVKGVRDLTTGFDSRQSDGKAQLPTSSSTQMITFYFENGLEATLRTSGTEPKIKYYTELISPPGVRLDLIFYLSNFNYLHLLFYPVAFSDRQQVENTLKEMVEALVDEYLQPTLHNLTPRPE